MLNLIFISFSIGHYFTFLYFQVENETITKTIFSNLFGGSELVVAGKLKDGARNLESRVEAASLNGVRDFQVPVSIFGVSNKAKKRM